MNDKNRFDFESLLGTLKNYFEERKDVAFAFLFGSAIKARFARRATLMLVYTFGLKMILSGRNLKDVPRRSKDRS